MVRPKRRISSSIGTSLGAGDISVRMYPHVHRAAPPGSLDDVHALTPFVSEVWSARLAPGQRHLVVPDGCIDLVFRDGADAELLWVATFSSLQCFGP